MTRPRVVVIDDHGDVRAGIRSYLSERYTVCGEAADIADGIDQVLTCRPDVVVLDVHLPSGHGSRVVSAVKQQLDHVKVLAFSVSAEREDVASMLRAGVDGYVLKSTFGEQLVDLVDELLDGETPVSPQIAGFMLDIGDAIDPTEMDPLTPRERQVVELIARGYTYRRVAHELTVSEKTVGAHMYNIFGKLGVASRHELSMEAYRRGIVDPPGDRWK